MCACLPNYRLGDEIGSGNFGVVLHGVWIYDNECKQVAIKTLHVDASGSEEEKMKLLKEAAIVGQFSHANVIKLHGYIKKDPVSYLSS